MGGFAIFRRNPVMLGMLVVTYWFTVLFLNVVPVVGVLMASLAIPGLSVGLMQAARNLERGQPIGLQTLFGSLKDNGRTLVALGALYLCATLGVLGLSSLLDGGELMQFMLASNRAERAAVEDSDFLLSAMFVMMLMVPVLMAWWFAPVLAAWHRLSVGRALFFSFMACWMNWRPFLTYGIALLVVVGVLPGLLLGILLLLMPGAANLATAILTLPMVLVVAPTVFASFYASYRDIFGISEIV
ncbi:BPSS1780 family membrane protein [Dechloromonas sp. CZR5]|uniref:BPSS1780 family membrane protein n=1 Tax=Dechloromonas sp. CZR5 TaxID=2608630 RepID=UPI001CC516E5|nr:BPSS1780 family membrane protein [Dechloromonas sp. CZR5]